MQVSLERRKLAAPEACEHFRRSTSANQPKRGGRLRVAGWQWSATLTLGAGCALPARVGGLLARRVLVLMALTLGAWHYASKLGAGCGLRILQELMPLNFAQLTYLTISARFLVIIFTSPRTPVLSVTSTRRGRGGRQGGRGVRSPYKADPWPYKGKPWQIFTGWRKNFFARAQVHVCLCGQERALAQHDGNRRTGWVGCGCKPVHNLPVDHQDILGVL